MAHARLLRDESGITRPILVDDLAGSGHLAYGGLPNMSWVIGRGGRILYKADWTSARNVEAFVERQEAAGASSPGRVRTRYATEQIEFRDSDPAFFWKRLERNGPRAVVEFRRAEEYWNAQARTRP
jgi:hypothetical protein